MTHDSTDHHGHGPTQADFVGWLALVLMAVAIVFPLLILLAALTGG